MNEDEKVKMAIEAASLCWSQGKDRIGVFTRENLYLAGVSAGIVSTLSAVFGSCEKDTIDKILAHVFLLEEGKEK